MKTSYQILTLGFIFGIIGLPLFFTGCLTTINNACYAYITSSGYAYNYDIISKQCKQKDKYVTCYDVYIKLSYSSNNITCLANPFSNEKSYSEAYSKTHYDYPLNKYYDIFVQKFDETKCYLQNGYSLQLSSIFGITLTCIGGLILVIGVFYYVKDFCSDYKKIIHPVVINQNESVNENDKFQI